MRVYPVKQTIVSKQPWVFGKIAYRDVARAANVSMRTARRDRRAGKWDPFNFESIVGYVLSEKQAPGCRRHPKYQVKRKPASKCKRCWDLWMSKSNEHVR